MLVKIFLNLIYDCVYPVKHRCFLKLLGIVIWTTLQVESISTLSFKQKLSEELDRVSLERTQLEKDLETERKKTKLPEIGYKELENRWKLATTESAKLSFQVKTLRGENEMLTAKQKELRERC